MKKVSKTTNSVLCSLLFISIACERVAAFGNNPKTQPRNLQVTDSDSPREVLKKALSAAQKVTSYRVRIEAPSVPKSAIVMEYASPDRAHMFTMTEEKARVDKEELVWIGKNIYHKKGDGSWEKYEQRNSDVSTKDVPRTNLPGTALENLIKSLSEADEIKYIGPEIIDGTPTLSYNHTTKHTTGSGQQAETMKSWIGAADGLLRRWEFECIVTGSTKSTVVHTYYDYDADIAIEAPKEYVSVPFPVPVVITEAMQVDPRLEPKRDELVVTAVVPRGEPVPASMGPGSAGGIGPGSAKGRAANPEKGIDANAPTTNVDSRPILLNNPQPNYTELARKNEVEGIVRLRILIGQDGLVKRVTVSRGLPDGLDEQAILAAYQMRFKPAMKGGQPVAYMQGVDVEFKLGK
ncbi:MAG TPA: energy transducer TonB [Blastocatellia bacterium]|nr:energy transducer TonB [Blastocatellia bacterium]